MIIVFVIFAAVGLAVTTNWWRSNLRADFVLMPNCLMTRSPVVFVDGWRSPFYFLKYWNGIPHYLREHGYEVIELNLPWRDATARQQDLSHFLEAAKNQNLSFHFVFDAAGKKEAARLKEWNHLAAKSITVATPEYFGWSDEQEPLKAADLLNFRYLFTKLAIFCHQLYLPADLQFNSTTLGLPFSTQPFAAEKEFLRLAISLAEKEMKLAHNLRHDVHQ